MYKIFGRNTYYFGDVNIEHGGTFFDMDEFSYGTVPAIEVTSYDDDNIAVRSTSVIVDNEDILKEGMKLCGYDGDISELTKEEICLYCFHYHFDVDTTLLIEESITSTGTPRYDVYRLNPYDGTKMDDNERLFYGWSLERTIYRAIKYVR